MDICVGAKWQAGHHHILQELKEEVLAKPVLIKPNFTRQFYLKTDWLATAMGVVLLQVNNNPEAVKAEQLKDDGGPCMFDFTVTGKQLHLRPVAFLSHLCLPRETSYHSYRKEAAVGVWAIKKFWSYLYGQEFTWITDCSSL